MTATKEQLMGFLKLEEFEFDRLIELRQDLMRLEYRLYADKGLGNTMYNTSFSVLYVIEDKPDWMK